MTDSESSTSSADEPLVLDRRARRLAQENFTTPLVLEAGAGTGKTATLVNRVLAWTLGPGWDQAQARMTHRPADLDAPDADPQRRIAALALRQVVAITFTEAAAAEMAERVVAALRQLREGERPVGFLHDASGFAVRAGHLLGVADQLQVRTIHGFCRRLLVDYPFDAGLHPHFTVDAECRQVRIVVEEIVREALPEAYGDPGDPAYLELAGMGIGPVEIAEALIALVAKGSEPGDLEADPLAPERVGALLDRLEMSLGETLNLLERRLTGARRAKNARLLADGLRQLVVQIEGFAPSHCDAQLTSLVATTKEALPETLRTHLAGWARGRFNTTERDHLGADEPVLRQSAQRLAPLVGHALRLDPLRLDAARQALSPLLGKVRQRLHVEGVLVFDDLLRRAARLLRDRPVVATQNRQRITQLLVDEFQDTDARQCELIRSLAFGGTPDDRPGLFVVGDPKQSIYGWRNADLAAYEAFVEALLAAGGERLPLVENFRSIPAVLDEVTRVIAPVMRYKAGIQPPFEPLVPCAAMRHDPGPTASEQAPVEHWLSWRADGDLPPARTTDGSTATSIEAMALIRDLRRLRQQHVGWRDIGLLVRATTDIETYLGALREAGIPFVVSHDRQYFRRREIIEATATVCAILAPDDELALLAFLRSTAVGVPDAALLPLWRRGLPACLERLMTDDPATLQEANQIIRQAADETPQVSGLDRLEDWPVALRHAVASLGALREAYNQVTADVFIATLRQRLRSEIIEAARYLGPYRLANLDRFFTELQEDLERNDGDRHAVLRLLRLRGAGGIDREEAPPPNADSDAVQIMTIHRAKGLQFEHVYLLQTHKEARPRGIPTVELEHHDGRLELTLFGAPSPAWDRVLARRDEVAAAELVRTLYVALTRAARRLVVIGCRDLEVGGDMGVAATHGQLLDRRDGAGPDVATLLEAADAGQAVSRGDDGVLWRIPAAESDFGAHPLSSDGEELVPDGGKDLMSVARKLVSWRLAADKRMARPFGSAASSLGKTNAPPPSSLERSDTNPITNSDPERDPKRRLAMAAGSLVHLAFENVVLDGPLDPALGEQIANLENLVDGVAQPAEAQAALDRATRLLTSFLRGSLRDRFESIRPHIVAREVPLVAPPDDNDRSDDQTCPVAFVAGTVDMIYLDPTRGPVIVDYKTDPVPAGTPDEVLGARYGAQANLYARALETALGLDSPPPVELWYLAADRVVEVNR